jgi:hypothetical protein
MDNTFDPLRGGHVARIGANIGSHVWRATTHTNPQSAGELSSARAGGKTGINGGSPLGSSRLLMSS